MSTSRQPPCPLNQGEVPVLLARFQERLAVCSVDANMGVLDILLNLLVVIGLWRIYSKNAASILSIA
jgi:hypothetical protein